jgi:hypothetical protein
MLRKLKTAVSHLLSTLTLCLYYYIPIVWAHCRLLHRRRDIREIVEGSVAFPTGKYAIYVLWQQGEIPWYVENMLRGLREQQVNCIVVANSELTPSQRDALRAKCAEILVRGNMGLDFGAYKDAVLYLSEKGHPIERVLFLNDSTFVFQKGLPILLSELLDDKYAVGAPFETWEFHHHFQSFCISISGAIFHNSLFQRFWRKYLPVSNRRWCIHAGEIAFSRVLRQITDSYRIIFSANDVARNIAGMPAEELSRYRDFLPIAVRHKAFNDKWESIFHRDVASERIGVAVADVIAEGNQAHRGGFFFMQFNECPLLKRDLVHRLLFTLTEIDRNFMQIGEVEHKDEVLNDLRRRGVPQFHGLMRWRYRLGLI